MKSILRVKLIKKSIFFCLLNVLLLSPVFCSDTINYSGQHVLDPSRAKSLINVSINTISLEAVIEKVKNFNNADDSKSIKLDLKNNHISDEGAKYLAEELKNINLEWIDLSFNKITEVGLKYIISFLEKSQNIKYICIYENPVINMDKRIVIVDLNEEKYKIILPKLVLVSEQLINSSYLEELIKYNINYSNNYLENLRKQYQAYFDLKYKRSFDERYTYENPGDDLKGEKANSLANKMSEFHRYDRAREYYLIAIKKGNVEAPYNLSKLYELGYFSSESESQDSDEEYFKFLNQAINMGNTKAEKEYHIASPQYDNIRKEIEIWKKNGKTQEQIAQELGVSGALVSMFLNYKVKTSPKILKGFQKREQDTLYALGDYYYLGQQFSHDNALKVKTSWFPSKDKKRVYYGIGRVQIEKTDYQKAFEIYSKTASQGHLGALWTLGECYELGRGVEKNIVKAIEFYLKAANKNFPPAQCCLGSIYAHGNGVDKNASMALAFYQKAANQNYADAQFCLGCNYENGELGLGKNYEEAVDWYSKAAEQGHGLAQFNLAVIYYNKDGLKDKEEYRSRLFQAARLEVPLAQHNVGVIYALGLGVEKEDYKKAFKWFSRAAEQECVFSQYDLGWMYVNGFGVEKDYEKAVDWYSKAAEQEFKKAQNALGWMYANGFGVEKDYEKAIDWYSKAANHGDAEAERNLGCMYASDAEVEKDYEKAVDWYSKAANRGDIIAQNNLGWMYANGFGVKKNFITAIDWFRKAADQGDETAKKNLSEVQDISEFLSKIKSTLEKIIKIIAQEDESDKKYLSEIKSTLEKIENMQPAPVKIEAADQREETDKKYLSEIKSTLEKIENTKLGGICNIPQPSLVCN